MSCGFCWRDIRKGADGELSIREFCDLDTPIFMFDKNEAFVVLRLEQVCTLDSAQTGLRSKDNL